MNDTVDLRASIIPKSDRINADDFLTGARAVTVVSVKRGDADTPVAIQLAECKPYFPCKSMRRVLVAAWGDDGRTWAGKRMRLYTDPEVAFGGVKVGGIRIAEMSDIKGTRTFMLTATRGKKKEFTVREFVETAEPEIQQYPDALFAENLPKIRKAIADGKLKPDDAFARLEKTGRLTAVQKLAITAADDGESEGVF